MTQRRPLAPRVWEKVAVRGYDECWEWTAAQNALGYGIVGDGTGRSLLAHRAAWMLTNGPIPEGLGVLHRCDNPPCCRPDHLFLGTHADNMADAALKGRSRRFALKGEQHPHAVLTNAQVRAIRAEYMSVAMLAAKYGVAKSTIHGIVRGDTRRTH